MNIGGHLEKSQLSSRRCDIGEAQAIKFSSVAGGGIDAGDCSGIADNQLRGQNQLLNLHAVRDRLDDFAGSRFPLQLQRLLYGGERGINDAGCEHIVKTYDGKILGDAPSVFAEAVESADSRDTVERHQGGELGTARKELLNAPRALFKYADLWGSESFQLHDQSWVRLYGKAACRSDDRIPAVLRLRTLLVAFDKSDFAMTERDQMLKRTPDSRMIVNHDRDASLNGVRLASHSKRELPP